MEYYPSFHQVILHLKVGYQCVPHPFAMGLNPFDLHALDTPPAFILSQDQTLRSKYSLALVSTIASFHTHVKETQIY